jgi:hypothetical protein
MQVKKKKRGERETLDTFMVYGTDHRPSSTINKQQTTFSHTKERDDTFLFLPLLLLGRDLA